jgi:hypothetical protein
MFCAPEPPPVRETRLNVRVEPQVPRTFQGGLDFSRFIWKNILFTILGPRAASCSTRTV